MKIIISLIITCAFLTTLNGIDTGYDIGNFKHTDLQEYYLSPSISNHTGYVDWKNDGYGSAQSNGFSINGSLKLIKPGSEFLVSTENDAAISTTKNGDYIVLFLQDKKNRQKDIFATYGQFWLKEFHFSNQIEYRKYNDINFKGFALSNSYQLSNSRGRDPYFYNDTNINKNWILENQLAGVIGNGRLYECQEAYTAWYFFKELEKNGCLEKQYSSTDIDDIATTLYNLRSLHEIDSRRNYVTKATTLIDELISKDYIKTGTQSKAAAILIELWQQGDKTERLTGTRLEIKPLVSLTNFVRRTVYESSDSSPYTDIDKYYRFIGGMELELKHERPYHNIYQLSSALSAQEGFYNSFYKGSPYETTSDKGKSFLHIAAECKISCYPDCRSHYSIGINSNYYFNNSPYTRFSEDYLSYLLFRNHSKNFITSINLNADYQLTYRLFLNGNISETLRHHKQEGYSAYQITTFNAFVNLVYRIY